jgi:hypothetical protein
MRRGLMPPVLLERTSLTMHVGGRAAYLVKAHIARRARERRRDTQASSTEPMGPCKGKESSAIPAIFLFLLSLSHVSDPYPLAYKREREDPRRGIELSDTHAPT